jgi:hypothetical protein
MATQRQIEANRRNAMRSKGPSESGKSRSRLNAVKHGMAARLPDVEIGHSPEFLDRRARWGDEFQPASESAQWALDRAVAASLRIERCERTFDGIVEAARDRARLSWDEDQAVKAAAIAARLAKDPVLASRELETTCAGVTQLLELWQRLVEAIRSEGGWSDSDQSKALDLLGVPADLRSGRTPIDPDDGSDPLAFREALALDEIERLKSLRDEVLDELDELERNRAMAGGDALFSKPARLVLRYERDPWRRYRESIQEVRDQASEKAEAPPIPIKSTPKLAPEKRPAPPPYPELPMPTEQERQELLAEAKAFLASIGHPLASGDFGGDDAWLDEFEGLVNELDRVHGSPATERTQIVARTRSATSAG